jgi:hypothetical protein
MSVNVDFIFNVPSKFDEASEFVSLLKKDLGLNFDNPNKYGVWVGTHLGLELSFDPEHESENDGDIPYKNYKSSIGLTGYTGQGGLRVVMVHELINISMALCYFYEVEGIVVWENFEKVIHLGSKKNESCIINMATKEPIKSYSDIPLVKQGVKY